MEVRPPGDHQGMMVVGRIFTTTASRVFFGGGWLILADPGESMGDLGHKPLNK